MKTSMTLSVLVALLVGLSITSCAAMRDAYCHYDGAFSQGMNDAREGKRMNGDPAMICHEPDKEVVSRAYREGYLRGTDSGRSVVAMPPQQCIRAYGQEACGYNCVKSYGQLACASHPSENCVASYGKIRCGSRCRAEYGQIVCD